MTEPIAVAIAEFKRIFALAPVFSTLVVAICIYSVFYPQPYLNEALRDVPVVLVDQDGTPSSRAFARLLDTAEFTAVSQVLPDLPSAEREVYKRAVYGIVVIPKNFERDLLHGRPSPIAVYADASYFMLNSRVTGGVSSVARAFGAQVETARLIGAGVEPNSAIAATDPMPLTTVPLFNPQGGYATYLLPAAFILLLQQTLLIGVGLLGTLPGNDFSDRAGPVSIVLGKLLAYLALQSITVSFYVVALPYLYGIPRLGSFTDIAMMGAPFILSVGALGMVVAAAFRKPVLVQLALGAVGMPFLFLTGFSWPAEAIPPSIQIVAMAIPSTFAIDGMVRVAQMGATLWEVHRQFVGLWILAGIYMLLAIVLEVGKRRSTRPLVADATVANDGRGPS